MIQNYYASLSHLKSGNVQKMKREESRHVYQLIREKDSIYSALGVVKRTLILISSQQGTYQATKLTTKSNHLKDLTAKWIEIATKLNHEPVLRLLSSGDVARNELCYHDKCYDTTRCQYSKFTKSESDESSSMRDTECKQIALKKIIFYLKDSEMSNPGNLYPVMELETMYSNLLKSDNIHHNNHTTTFGDLLVKYVPSLNKKTANKRVSVFFDTAAIGLNTSSETLL